MAAVTEYGHQSGVPFVNVQAGFYASDLLGPSNIRSSKIARRRVTANTRRRPPPVTTLPRRAPPSTLTAPLVSVFLEAQATQTELLRSASTVMHSPPSTAASHQSAPATALPSTCGMSFEEPDRTRTRTPRSAACPPATTSQSPARS
ncbi:hypothetical protein C8R43DRAFT_1234363 [Mycena crocata]|nr:hypothetical protein C8R43DRAFT_1234363 [Mycena crocata]